MSSLQELVDRGQFAAASVLLESGPPGPINSVTRQLALQNNRAVLGFLQDPRKVSSQVEDWLQCLQHAAGIPASPELCEVELATLFNLSHPSTQKSSSHPLTLPVWHRTLDRVVRVLRGGRTAPGYGRDQLSVCHGLLLQCVQALPTFAVSGQSGLCCMLARCVWGWTLTDLLTSDHTQYTQAKHESQTQTGDLLMAVNTALGDTHFMDSEAARPVLTLPLYVDHSQLPSSPRLVKPLTAYLLAVWQCGQGRHDDCCNTLEMIDEPQLVPAVKFLLEKKTVNGYNLLGFVTQETRTLIGFAHYKRAEYMEAIPVLMETLRSPGPITPRLKAQLYYLAGQCFSKLKKYQLAVAMYTEAVCANFNFLRPLHAASLVYRHRGQADLELECLNLLNTALEMGDEDSPVHHERNPGAGILDLVSLVPRESGELTHTSALYLLASRSAHLHRYDVAAEKYRQLLGQLKSEGTKVLDLPPVMQVFHEAMKAFYGNHDYSECVELCDHTLLCYHNNQPLHLTPPTMHGIEGQNRGHRDSVNYNRGRNAILTDSQTYNKRSSDIITDEMDVCVEMSDSRGSNINHTQTEKMDVVVERSGLKRKLSDGGEVDKHYGNTDVVALKWKALSLHKLGNIEESLKCIESAIDAISTSRQQKLRNLLSRSNEPAQKRRKTVNETSNQNGCHGNQATTSEHTKCNETELFQSTVEKLKDEDSNGCDLIRTECELYKIAGDILQEMKQDKDAAHYRRLAAELKHVQNVD